MKNALIKFAPAALAAVQSGPISVNRMPRGSIAVSLDRALSSARVVLPRNSGWEAFGGEGVVMDRR